MNAPQALGHPDPWPAPGKLNLFLHIVGRRSDGYHLLQTAFQFIDLCDELSFWHSGRRRHRAGRRGGRRPGGRGPRAARRTGARGAGTVSAPGVGIELRQADAGRRAASAAAARMRPRCWSRSTGSGGCDLSVEALAALGLASRRRRAGLRARPGRLGRGRRRAADAGRLPGSDLRARPAGCRGRARPSSFRP